MPSKPKDQELIPADDKPVWLVTSSEPDDHGGQIYRLFHGTKSQSMGRTPGDLRRFRDIADFCNKRGLQPVPKVLCKADQNLPVAKHKAHAENPESAAP